MHRISYLLIYAYRYVCCRMLKRVVCNILTMHERILARSHTVSNSATSNTFNNRVSVDFGASCEVFLQLFCAPMNKKRDMCILRRKSCRSCSHAVMCDRCLLLRTSGRHRLSYIAHHSISATFLLLCFGILLRINLCHLFITVFWYLIAHVASRKLFNCSDHLCRFVLCCIVLLPSSSSSSSSVLAWPRTSYAM